MITKRPIKITGEDDQPVTLEGRARPNDGRSNLAASKWTPQRANILDGSGMFHLGPGVEVQKDDVEPVPWSDILRVVFGIWLAVMVTWAGIALNWQLVARNLSWILGL